MYMVPRIGPGARPSAGMNLLVREALGIAPVRQKKSCLRQRRPRVVATACHSVAMARRFRRVKSWSTREMPRLWTRAISSPSAGMGAVGNGARLSQPSAARRAVSMSRESGFSSPRPQPA